jgi:hypothetical protein
MIVALLAAALAQPTPGPGDGDPAVNEEIVVVGDGSVAAARERLVGAFEDAGWRVHAERKDGTLVFKHARDGWKGAFLVGPEGSVRTRRPVAYVQAGSIFPPVIAANFLPSQKKLKGPRQRTLEAVEPRLEDLADARAREAEDAVAADLIARLDRLWTTGEPLDGGPPLPDPATRRRAALDAWASRTESPAGRRMMDRIALWIDETIQRSPHPLTDDEIRAAEDRRSDGHPLRLRGRAAPGAPIGEPSDQNPG